MALILELNGYITVYSELDKILIFVKGEKFHELDSVHVRKILEASSLKGNNLNSYSNLNESLFNDFVNLLICWIQKKYDTNLLFYEISLPLLKKLVEVGDSRAKKVFVDEILKNLWYADHLVLKYLIDGNYQEYVSKELNRRKIHVPKIKETKLTISICLINILVYILFTEVFFIKDLFIFDYQKISKEFEVWRLFSAFFIHSERFSLFINSVFLYCVGSYFEMNNFLSRKFFFIVYLLSGIMGNLIYLLFCSQFTFNVQSAGASGAIFGLVGAFIIILAFKKKYKWLTSYFLLFIFFYVFTINPIINYIIHFFGFLIGFLSYLLGFIINSDKV
jgi:membrane associated rhomboid family serine protease